MRSFEEILKEFENFFNLENDTKKTTGDGKFKARDVNIELEIEFMDSVQGITKQV